METSENGVLPCNSNHLTFSTIYRSKIVALPISTASRPPALLIRLLIRFPHGFPREANLPPTFAVPESCESWSDSDSE
jgi:hypothetical protein